MGEGGNCKPQFTLMPLMGVIKKESGGEEGGINDRMD